MDFQLEDIRQGLMTFDTTYFQTPGRLNVFDEHPFKVILDYAHNPAAIKALCHLATNLDVSGERAVVLAAPGDRRDEDVQQIAKHAAGCFDRYICRRDDGLRGRSSEEIPNMLRDALLEAGVSKDQIHLIPDEQEATLSALSSAKEGDLVLVFGDNIERTWKQIIEFDASGGEVAATSTPTVNSPAPLPEMEASATLNEDQMSSLIRDERGVRLAREEND